MRKCPTFLHIPSKQEEANRQYEELTASYREALRRGSAEDAAERRAEEAAAAAAAARRERDALATELAQAREKVISLDSLIKANMGANKVMQEKIYKMRVIFNLF